MKRIIAFLLALVLSFGIVGCGVEKQSISLDYGATEQITLNKEYSSIKWESNDETIAVVRNGLLNAVGPGATTISAMDGDKVVAEIEVEVNIVRIEEIILNRAESEIEIGESTKLTYSLLPNNASDYGITWKSTNTDVATVDSEGNIVAVDAGTSTIICSSATGNYATCEITVNPPSAIEQLNETEKELFDFLVNTVLSNAYAADKVRIRDLFYYKSSRGVENQSVFVFDVQAQNRLGGTIYSYLVCSVGANLYYDNGTSKTNNGSKVPSDVVDYTKINAALAEYWETSGLN